MNLSFNQMIIQIFLKWPITNYQNHRLYYLSIHNSMINLQNSKKLIKTYDKMLHSVYPSRNSSKGLNKLNRTTFQDKNIAFVGNSSRQKLKDNSQEQKRKDSKHITIQFHEHKRIKQHAQIRMRRKMLTSSEKLYLQKKNAYSNYIKQIYIKVNEELNKANTFLTIGSHAIRKMDYAQSLYNKELKAEHKHETYLKNKFKQQLALNLSQNSSLQKADFNKVLVFGRKQSKSVILPFGKSDKSVKTEAKTIQKDKYLQSAEQFIPIKKALNKKQPFVFGMSQKTSSQKMRDKILLYHDFLWKINYANGLFVSASSEQTTYKAYIGPGNNSNMVRGILKRRFWWTIVEKPEYSNFSWTQLKVNSIFRDYQKPSERQIPNSIAAFEDNQEKDLQKDQPLHKTIDINCHEKIFNQIDLKYWEIHFKKHKKYEENLTQKTYLKRSSLINRKQLTKIQNSKNLVIHNHLQQNYFIGNKKALFYNMKKYYEYQGKNVFEVLPLTFHLIKGLDDSEYKRFHEKYVQIEERKKNGSGEKNMWIMKPGENSNRGNGISVCHSLDDVTYRLKCKERNSDGSLRTFILQKYIEKPLLYKQRKFDIRHYLLITCFNGSFRAYWYPEGYIRTSSAIFNLKKGSNLFVHLTNDAIQKNSDEYGKYEKGNKISYDKFQEYLNKTLKKKQKNIFYERILPKMKSITTDAVKSTYLTLDQKRKEHNFELLGMDFMIDQELNPWLIQINTNPCLELSSPLLSRLIPSIVENAFRICVDPFFPPPQDWPCNKKMFINQNPLEQNLFQLIFDQSIDGKNVEKVFKGDYKLDSNVGKIDQDVEIYENDGAEEWEAEPQPQN